MKDEQNITELQEEARQIRRTSQVYGGSFVAALFAATAQADYINLRKIKAAFPEYWEQYLEMAKRDE